MTIVYHDQSSEHHTPVAHGMPRHCYVDHTQAKHFMKSFVTNNHSTKVSLLVRIYQNDHNEKFVK